MHVEQISRCVWRPLAQYLRLCEASTTAGFSICFIHTEPLEKHSHSHNCEVAPSSHSGRVSHTAQVVNRKRGEKKIDVVCISCSSKRIQKQLHELGSLPHVFKLPNSVLDHRAAGKQGRLNKESHKYCPPKGCWWQVMLFIFIVIIRLVSSWNAVIWKTRKKGKEEPCGLVAIQPSLCSSHQALGKIGLVITLPPFPQNMRAHGQPTLQPQSHCSAKSWEYKLWNQTAWTGKLSLGLN